MTTESGKPKKRILVVDDDKVAVELAEIKLRKLGYDTITAISGRDCLRIAESENPDLILLDIMMPGLDGGATAQLLSENPKTKDIPVIYTTILISEEEERRDLGESQGRLFVAKPLNKEKLSKTINKILFGT